jgi:hypothetical protein
MKGSSVRRCLRVICFAFFLGGLIVWLLSYHPATPIGDHYKPGSPIKVYFSQGAFRIKFIEGPPTPSTPGGVYEEDLPVPIPCFVFVFLLAFALTFLPSRYLFRHPPGHCQHCGYSLTGNTSGVCPECGTAVASDPPH